MELYIGVAVVVALAAVAGVMRRRRRARQVNRRGTAQDPHLTWVEDLKRQVASRRQDDDTQPWSRDQ